MFLNEYVLNGKTIQNKTYINFFEILDPVWLVLLLAFWNWYDHASSECWSLSLVWLVCLGKDLVCLRCCFRVGVVPSAIPVNFWPLNGEIPATKLGSWLLSSGGLTHHWSSEQEMRGKSLQQSTDPEWGWNPQWRELVGWCLYFVPGRGKLPGVQTPVGWAEEGLKLVGWLLCFAPSKGKLPWVQTFVGWEEGRCTHKHAMEQLKQKVRCNIIKVMKIANINSTEIK